MLKDMKKIMAAVLAVAVVICDTQYVNAGTVSGSDYITGEQEICSVSGNVSENNPGGEVPQSEQETGMDREQASEDGQEQILEEASVSENSVSENSVSANEYVEIKYEASDNIVDSGTCGDNLTWTITDEEEGYTLTISGYGDMYGYSNKEPDLPPWNDHKEELKNLVLEEGITSIGEYAFYHYGFDCPLVLPQSLKKIYSGAFEGCSSFYGKLEIPSNVEIINSGAFGGCKGFTGDLVVPDNVTSVGISAFSGCSGFDGKLYISKKLDKINYSAFSGCSGLRGNIVIPKNILRINSGAFRECTGFDGKLSLPATLQEIGYGAFYGCSNISGGITIPKSVTTIEGYSFYKCSGLNGSLKLPDTLQEIKEYAFYGCEKLKGKVSFPKGLKTIGKYAFSGCKKLSGSLTLPDSVTEIGEFAFDGCSGFKGKLTLPKYIERIELCSFYGCSGLTGDLVIPDSVTYIGTNAFLECSGFNGTLKLSANLQEIEFSAFSGCKRLKGNLIIPDSVTKLGSSVFYNCSFDGILKISAGLSSIGRKVFAGNRFTSIYIPPNITRIDEYAFVERLVLHTMCPVYGYEDSYAKEYFDECMVNEGFSFVPLGDIYYTITYNMDGGRNSLSNIYIYNGKKEVKLKSPTRRGYTFKGWYKDEELTRKITKIKKGTTGDITLYARWEPVKYKVSYSLNGGKNSADNPTRYEVTTELTTLAEPVRKGYTFEGWYSDSKYKYPVTEIAGGKVGNIKLYARWKKDTYTVTYNMADTDAYPAKNSSKNPVKYTVTTSTITLKNPTRTGYKFLGWYDTEDYSGNRITKIKKGSVGNITLYAKWEVITYTITYKLNGGAMPEGVSNPETYKITTKVKTLKEPVKEGYEFAGWYKDSKYKKPVTTVAGGTTGSLVLYAKWSRANSK